MSQASRRAQAPRSGPPRRAESAAQRSGSGVENPGRPGRRPKHNTSRKKGKEIIFNTSYSSKYSELLELLPMSTGGRAAPARKLGLGKEWESAFANFAAWVWSSRLCHCAKVSDNVKDNKTGRTLADIEDFGNKTKKNEIVEWQGVYEIKTKQSKSNLK
ncbi:hypothetical protein R3P38DRAFT_2813911 [Favolaschia claudopus]|uniref:Uncharacterized protein n=1 Tax=Favolaschia claudopus TaxID=2862362 RepID=A0AAV9Z4X2_9AGAR